MTDYYDLDGTKILLCINVKKYPLDPDTGRSRDRNGSEIDEKAIIETFKERIYGKLFSRNFLKITSYALRRCFLIILSYFRLFRALINYAKST